MSSQLPLEGDFALVAEGLSRAADEALRVLKDQVAAVMREHGEDPEEPALLALRVRQAAYSMDSRAAKEQEAASEQAWKALPWQSRATEGKGG